MKTYNLLLVIILFLLCGCRNSFHIEKRKYRPGWYIQLSNNRFPKSAQKPLETEEASFKSVAVSDILDSTSTYPSIAEDILIPKTKYEPKSVNMSELNPPFSEASTHDFENSSSSLLSTMTNVHLEEDHKSYSSFSRLVSHKLKPMPKGIAYVLIYLFAWLTTAIVINLVYELWYYLELYPLSVFTGAVGTFLVIFIVVQLVRWVKAAHRRYEAAHPKP